MKVTHLRKKDVIKSSVKGIGIEFDHERLATILGVPSRNGICEYIKENVIPRFEKRDTSSFMDLTYMDHLMARRLVNLPRVMMRHMSYVISMKDHELPYGKMEYGGYEVERTEEGMRKLRLQRKMQKRKKKEIRMTLKSRCETPAAPAVPASSSAQQQDQEPSGVDPSGPTSREAEFLKFQAEFERKRANRFHDDLEKAKAENARLLALLHQAQTKPHP
ncbi:hypothetical protein Dimus_006083 [Dionaea muscipula]